ncbi:MAG: hypothetical protein WCN95_08255 [bacterium]
MTTLYKRKVCCSVCGTGTEFTEIMSTNTCGSPDLDTRPPEMQRSTMFAWVQRCPECGYSASDISEAAPAAEALIAGAEYRALLKDEAYSALATSFLCVAILAREVKKFGAATWALIHAAWDCDDSDCAELAGTCRKKAAEMLVLSEEHCQQVAGQDGASTAILVDLLRRSGQKEAARHVISTRRGLIKENVIIGILDYQDSLLAKNDISCHTIAEAFGEKPQ